MGYFIDGAGNYYEGDRQPGSTAVPQRPALLHDWNGAAWVPNAKREAQAQIDALEAEQARRLTARGQREFYLSVFTLLNQTSAPAFTALKAIDDAIKVERGKL